MFQCVIEYPLQFMALCFAVFAIGTCMLGAAGWLLFRSWHDYEFDEKRRQRQELYDQMYKERK